MSCPEPFTVEQFYKFLAQHKLMAGRCQKCGKLHMPPRPLCDNCFSQQFDWVPVSGKGKLLTYTIISVAPQQFQNLTPYVVGIVQLENGLKIPGMIHGVKQEKIAVGIELTLDFGECPTSAQWPQWPRYFFKP